ncbi:TPA: hypothetical protein ACIBE3_002456 [Salmonella enterica subsp. enterica serovar Reading]
MKSACRKFCLFLSVLFVAIFAFRVWNTGQMLLAALLTILIAFQAIAVDYIP